MNTYDVGLSVGKTVELPPLEASRFTQRTNKTVLQGVGDDDEEEFVVGKIPVDGDEHDLPKGSEVLGISSGVGMSGSPQAWVLIPREEYE